MELYQDIIADCIKSDGSKQPVNVCCLNEQEIEVYINEVLSFIITCTNTHVRELITGRLISERIITDLSDIEKLYICDLGLRAKLFLKEGIQISNETLRIQSCCPGNQTYVRCSEENMEKSIDSTEGNHDIHLGHDAICKIITDSNNEMHLHKKTSGTHSCFLFHKDEMIFSCEDIGRHNALDKAIGYLVMNHMDPSECAVFTTGRVPVDMIRKVINTRIPVLISKSVATYQAIEIAKAKHIQLICKAWPDSYEIYN